ncbi:MAG: response regulator [Bacteroidetes bacterium]|nr:response regulator [Bacteroidota bacterium]MBU1579995.1 response regulator [Bacteroidota bacterium]MBU2559026.1 response regulator [Bacteroidota bacterium]
MKVQSFINESDNNFSRMLYSTENKEIGSYDYLKDALKGKKILIVEDIYSNFQLLSAYLTPTGATILHQEDGTSAFNLFKTQPDIEIILMDIRLPDISGLSVTRMIREISKDVKIIAQTAYALHSDRIQCLAAGCNDYIAKPIRRRELLDVIARYIRD